MSVDDACDASLVNVSLAEKIELKWQQHVGLLLRFYFFNKSLPHASDKYA